MNHIVGSAVKLSATIPISQVTGTTITLDSLIDPDGNELASSNVFTFGTAAGETNTASYVWQSSVATHPVGTYYYIVKAVNGSYSNYEKSNFTLTSRTQ